MSLALVFCKTRKKKQQETKVNYFILYKLYSQDRVLPVVRHAAHCKTKGNKHIAFSSQCKTVARQIASHELHYDVNLNLQEHHI